jgi:hypothetical protein
MAMRVVLQPVPGHMKKASSFYLSDRDPDLLLCFDDLRQTARRTIVGLNPKIKTNDKMKEILGRPRLMTTRPPGTKNLTSSLTDFCSPRQTTERPGVSEVCFEFASIDKAQTSIIEHRILFNFSKSLWYR